MKMLRFFMLFFCSILFAQASNCEVINEDLKGVYTGQCLSGLAHGVGVFVFENGMFEYKGHFKNGKMHGKGKIYSLINKEKKLVSEGSWLDNVFVIEKSGKPFDVKTAENVERHTVRKVNDGNRIFINFLRSGSRNDVSNVNVSVSSGNRIIGSSIEGVDNITFPVRCEITYNTANKINVYRFAVRYVVVINEPGEWEISLYN